MLRGIAFAGWQRPRLILAPYSPVSWKHEQQIWRTPENRAQGMSIKSIAAAFVVAFSCVDLGSFYQKAIEQGRR